MAKALEGVKVVDFGWIITGPLPSKVLGEHGATVVKVESTRNVDLTRVTYPYAQGKPGLNRSGMYASYNDQKYGITLNLADHRGIEIAKKLTTWADIIIENFTPGVMERWGLSYNDIIKFKPDIIMVSASMLGQWGPRTLHRGGGMMLQGLAGFSNLIGWQDRPPSGTVSAYTDFIAPWYIVVAVLAALSQRHKTGKGVYVDISQYEAGLSFLPVALLDYSANRRAQKAAGNRSSCAAPHGVYRCHGNDRWCAITVSSDQEWERFCQVIGSPDWTKDSKFNTVLGRKEHENELDRLVEQWTVNHSAEEIMEKLQAAGIAAGIVETGEDLHRDPQLAHRQHFRLINHPEMGETSYDAPSFRLSKTPAELKMPAPCLGQHTEYVCREILGMSDEDFAELLSEGVFE